MREKNYSEELMGSDLSNTDSSSFLNRCSSFMTFLNQASTSRSTGYFFAAFG